jgi:hypothetical protein
MERRENLSDDHPEPDNRNRLLLGAGLYAPDTYVHDADGVNMFKRERNFKERFQSS